MSALVAAAGVHYRVGDATLVGGVDLHVATGEMVALIGPNGAGKTTLLRLLGGDLAPTEGQVAVGGDPVEGLSSGDMALRRSMLFRQPADVPFTASTVVALGRHPHRRDASNSRAHDLDVVADAMERTDTAHLALRTFSTLSGGERTRVALARILAQDAPLALLDEPTTALDVGHEELIMEALRESTRHGKGVIAILHDLNAAASYADRLVLMDGGNVRAEGTPTEVLREDVLSEVYGHPLRVIPHPYRGCPLVLVSD